MHFSHGVMFCRIIFRGAVKRTVCAALVVRKRCSKPHRKDMRRKVSVFVSQRLRYAKFYGPGSEKLFDKQQSKPFLFCLATPHFQRSEVHSGAAMEAHG